MWMSCGQGRDIAESQPQLGATDLDPSWPCSPKKQLLWALSFPAPTMKVSTSRSVGRNQWEALLAEQSFVRCNKACGQEAGPGSCVSQPGPKPRPQLPILCHWMCFQAWPRWASISPFVRG